MPDKVHNPDKLNREVYCFNCKIYSYNSEPKPICKCGNNLTTVVYNQISGQKITGVTKYEPIE